MNRLLTIQSKLKAPKSQFNSFGKYNYRNCEDILEALKPLLKETGTVLTLSDEVVMVGTRHYVRAFATLYGKDTTILQVSAYAREEETKKGMDGSQITGAASSYARKYALNGLFAIDDTRDADSNGVHAPSTTAPKTATSAPAKAPTTAPDDAEDPRVEIGHMLMEIAGNDKDEAAGLLEVLTTFTTKEGKEVRGKRSIKDLSDKHAVVTLKKVKEQHKKWLAAMDAPGPEDDIELEGLDGGPMPYYSQEEKT